MIPRAIHQFVSSLHAGDGIGNGTRFIDRLLRQAGIPGRIYYLDAPPSTRHQGHHWRYYRKHKQQVLLIHHGIANPIAPALSKLPDQRFMVFHNITPGHFFAADDPIQAALQAGWQQVEDWTTWLTGAIADSEQNLQQLLNFGHQVERCATIPLLVDLSQMGQSRPEWAYRQETLSLLFVGRIMVHKNQIGLVDMLYYLRRMLNRDVHLTLVGGVTDPGYADALTNRIQQLQLAEAVTVTGKVDDATLARLYQQADIFVSLSHHEGFGMPLIEAMAHQLTVVAYHHADSNVQHTLGRGGLLLDQDDPKLCAATLAELIVNPRVRGQLIANAWQHIQQFEPQHLYQQLRDFFARFAIDLPAHHFDASLPKPLTYRIEGPCTTNYSLALVNRYLAEALAQRHPGQVGLYATEGFGDLTIDAATVATDPPLQALIQQGTHRIYSECALRLLYPPRVSGLHGLERAISCYGWEESVFPHEYGVNFNQQLQFMTTMSDFVTRVCIDNGVTVPVYTIGLGADHSLVPLVQPQACLDSISGFCIIHISSGFPRKGIDVLLQAYGQAFTAQDAVTLVIKSFPNPHQQIHEQLAAWRANHQDPPPVLVFEDDWSSGALRALYQRADVCVAPSRGEGFGLPLAEAMLHECPVITTAYGGQCDFCTDDTSWLLDYRFAYAKTHMQQDDSVWVEPDGEQLTTLLTTFYHHYQVGTLPSWSAAKCAQARQLITERYTWAAVAQRLDNVRQHQAQQPRLLPRLRLGCVTTWDTKCGIATYSRYLLMPALADTIIFANTDATIDNATDEAMMVHRCWQMTQQADDLETLFHTIIGSGVRQVLIQFNFSFFDLVALQRLLQRLHDQAIQTMLLFHSTADVYWNSGTIFKSIRMLEPALHDCTRLFVHSIADLNRLKSWHLHQNASLWPHGVVAYDAAAESNSLFISMPVPAGRRVIASYGFLLPHKGIQTLIEAFAGLQQSDLHLLLLNACYPTPESSAERDACQNLIEHYQLADRVTLITDYLEDAQSLAWLAQADYIVFPYQSTQESSSAAVRWGLATGKPVLCTPLAIFDDVAQVVHQFADCTATTIQRDLNFMLEHEDILWPIQNRQQRWLQTHHWDMISQRLRQCCLALQVQAQTLSTVF
jgi:glycosyltransferase involved in cell wall biosynthesis